MSLRRMAGDGFGSPRPARLAAGWTMRGDRTGGPRATNLRWCMREEEMFGVILFAVDDLPHTVRAARIVRELAGATGDAVVVVHVQEFTTSRAGTYTFDEYDESFQTVAERVRELSEYVSENDHFRLLDQGFGPGGGAIRLSMRPTIAHLTIASWVSGSRS